MTPADLANLSDSEVRARLTQRGLGPNLVTTLVRARNRSGNDGHHARSIILRWLR